MTAWEWNAGLRSAIAAFGARLLVVMTLALLGAMPGSRLASAAIPVTAAAQRADAGLSACDSSSGQVLYRCVSDVLYRLCRDLKGADVQQTRSALDTAAARLRTAVSKVQALSAITQATALITGALTRARSVGGVLQGWGDGSGLAAIAGVLGHAAKLIQAKG